MAKQIIIDRCGECKFICEDGISVWCCHPDVVAVNVNPDDIDDGCPLENAKELRLTTRSIYHPCPQCDGHGWRWYASTALWREGPGCSKCSRGPCDKCWGSGDDGRPWTDMREVDAMRKELQRYRDAEGGKDDK